MGGLSRKCGFEKVVAWTERLTLSSQHPLNAETCSSSCNNKNNSKDQKKKKSIVLKIQTLTYRLKYFNEKINCRYIYFFIFNAK